MDLRKYAQGRECQIRFRGICNGNPETTVLCHLRMIDISGAGYKAPDLLAAWGCSACHDIADGRTSKGFTREEIRLGLFEGIVRTLNELIVQEKIHW